ncbi:MAG TPA: hypothetical protein VER17_18635 [Tepidisphaeraceae bacterium]|nr:hypothetical protein [Tepidisphaeraceae bacterium]
MTVPYVAIPALLAVTSAVFVYGRAVRLASLKTAEPAQRVAGAAWGIVGVAIGIEIIVGAVALYRGA